MQPFIRCAATLAIALPLCAPASRACAAPTHEVKGQASNAPVVKTTLSVLGMTCDHGCPTSIRKALMREPGFKSATIDHKKKEVVVTYDPKRTSPEKLAVALANRTGFTTTVKPPDSR
jgi:copper chaperone CopZ